MTSFNVHVINLHFWILRIQWETLSTFYEYVALNMINRLCNFELLLVKGTKSSAHPATIVENVVLSCTYLMLLPISAANIFYLEFCRIKKNISLMAKLKMRYERKILKKQKRWCTTIISDMFNISITSKRITMSCVLHWSIYPSNMCYFITLLVVVLGMVC